MALALLAVAGRRLAGSCFGRPSTPGRRGPCLKTPGDDRPAGVLARRPDLPDLGRRGASPPGTPPPAGRAGTWADPAGDQRRAHGAYSRPTAGPSPRRSARVAQSAAIELLDAATGRPRATLPTGLDHVLPPRLRRRRPDPPGVPGRRPALKEVVTWDASTGRGRSSRPITAPTQQPATRTISPDGRTLRHRARIVDRVQLWDLEADRRCGR